MFSYIKPISQILLETKPVSEMLIDAELYFAHIPYDKTNLRNPEILNEHILLVQEKFCALAEIHHIDGVVDSMICTLFSDNKIIFDDGIAEFIKKAWVNTVVFHDFGKVNENFQAHSEKMNNSNFKGKEKMNSPLKTNHSSLGAYLYIAKQFDEFSKFNKKFHEFLSIICLSFSYSIFKHHGKYLGDNSKEKIQFSQAEVECMQIYLGNYQWQIHESFSRSVPLNTSILFDRLNHQLNSFTLYSLVRLRFSMLTASDFLASGEYMTGLKIKKEDLGILTRNRIMEIYQYASNAENKKDGSFNFNKSTFAKSNTEYQYENLREKSNSNLNLLRQEMGIEVLQTIRKTGDNNLFYLEAPTGGGKTNLAFLATIELLKLHIKLNKVFYVFPFTTLVTQTQQSLIDTFGLTNDEVITLSSKSGFKEREAQNLDVNVEDDRYGQQKRFYLDNLFCFFPFCLLTHIKFFNILKTNEKEENYLLHRLANSVVVLDELQAYSPKEWDKLIYFIKNYAQYYNIKFIVMSATLPKLGNLNILKKYSYDFVYLIDNAKERYFKNPNFTERVVFNLDLFNVKDLKLEDLADLLLSKSKEYSEYDFEDAKPQGSVYTIIEFIFKKSATSFYGIIQNKTQFFDEVFVLSGTILEHRRKYIINYLKNKDNRKKKILLITTQVVEAGVDIDMDVGFKDKSLIDSDEQLAGRINRNINKRNCVLYLFNYNNERVIYGKDKRYENTKAISKEEYFDILTTKDFDKIYNKVLEGIDKWNTTEGAIGFEEYEHNIKKLRFQSVHFDFQLISNEQKNLSVFIPIQVPVYVNGISRGSRDEVFVKGEIEFLKQNGIRPNDENKIEGAQVFDLYLELIQQKGDITNKKVANRIMQGIMSKFIIQMLGTNKMESNLKHFYDQEKSDKGYIYLERWCDPVNQVYDENFGIDDSAFSDQETQFL